MPIFITLNREWKFFEHSGEESKTTFVPPGTYEVEKERGRLVLKGTNTGIDEQYLNCWKNPDCGEWQVTIKEIVEESTKEVLAEPSKETVPEMPKEAPQQASSEGPERKISPEEILEEIKKKRKREKAKE